ncbi:MAG: cell division protein FtsW (lipid II flippase), partial [Roseivirga sp.]
MKTSLIIGTVCIAILIFVLMLWFLFKFQSVYFEDYFDSNFEVSYNGDVKDIKRNRGFVYVELDNGEKYNISDSYN